MVGRVALEDKGLKNDLTGSGQGPLESAILFFPVAKPDTSAWLREEKGDATSPVAVWKQAPCYRKLLLELSFLQYAFKVFQRGGGFRFPQEELRRLPYWRECHGRDLGASLLGDGRSPVEEPARNIRSSFTFLAFPMGIKTWTSTPSIPGWLRNSGSPWGIKGLFGGWGRLGYPQGWH